MPDYESIRVLRILTDPDVTCEEKERALMAWKPRRRSILTRIRWDMLAVWLTGLALGIATWWLVLEWLL